MAPPLRLKAFAVRQPAGEAGKAKLDLCVHFSIADSRIVVLRVAD